MTNPSAGARAVSAYEIEDVFVVESNYWISREFNQTSQFPNFTYAHQSGMDRECLMQTRTPLGGGDGIYIIRYFMNAELRLLKPEVQVGVREPMDEDSLAVLKFKLAIDYRCPKDSLSDTDAVAAFSRNAHFHAWPYLREEVHAACARLRIPRLTLPMLRQDQADAAKKKATQKTNPE